MMEKHKLALDTLNNLRDELYNERRRRKMSIQSFAGLLNIHYATYKRFETYGTRLRQDSIASLLYWASKNISD